MRTLLLRLNLETPSYNFLVRILYIAYYFPPQGLSGVLRALKFAKALPSFGVEPVILAAETRFLAQDPSLLEELPWEVEVYRAWAWDPASRLRPPSEGSRERASRLSAWLAFPDSKALWLPPAFRLGLRLIREKRPSLILATLPPPSSAVLGYLLSKRTGLPLVLDYRDPWVGGFDIHQPTPLHRKLHGALERKVIASAREVIAVSQALTEHLKALYGVKATVIPHGYDPEDFPGEPPPPLSELKILYAGSFVRRRNPEFFLKALESLPFPARLTWAGTGTYRPRSPKLVALGYMPHREVCQLMERHHLLWAMVGEGPGYRLATPAKAFEYLGARRPILATGPPDSAPALLVKEVGGYYSPNEPEAVKRVLRQAWEEIKAGRWRVPSGTEKYSLNVRAEALTKLLKEVVKKSR